MHTTIAEYYQKLNQDIKNFQQVVEIREEMRMFKGVSRLVMLDRYTYKDTKYITLSKGDLVVTTIKEDPKFPARGVGYVTTIDWENRTLTLEIEEEFRSALEGEASVTGIITKRIEEVEKPLELSFEQIAYRVASGLSQVENVIVREEILQEIANQLIALKIIPAGRVLKGAGSGKAVTYFNCYVMPFVPDSREGISEHRKQVMEIMSRGGGVGTNGSTLRPRNALAKGVNGKSSGSVSWLDDIAKLTHLVEQGGSRRGAQMIMMNDWHPDTIEFIISKMQKPDILRVLIRDSKEPLIVKAAKEKLKVTPLTESERKKYEGIVKYQTLVEQGIIEADSEGVNLFTAQVVADAKQKLQDGETYSVHNPEFLTGANISVNITKEFMEAVENETFHELKFPDVENYDEDMMQIYNEQWHQVGDVREWERMGYAVRTYHKIDAKELWNLINFCATYSAEPGIFFIDNANEMTNAQAYGQKVVATNPCGEQPLAPFSVCNLLAINLAEFATPEKTVDFEELKKTVAVAVRMGDNVIDATPYFLEENKKQALSERRIGLGVMGLHDLLIKCETVYGSEEGNVLIDQVFETIATTAYRTSIELGKEKGSFPYLIGETEEKTTELRNKFINSGFMKKMPEDIRQDILTYGIRNSHLLTVAPTGSTGTMVGVSTGLEPYFSFSYYRSGRLGQFIPVVADIAIEWLEENGYEPTVENMVHLPEWFISSMQLSAEAHADVQCVIQRWIDSSISKTVNAPKGYTVEQVEKVYRRLWKGGAKGGTVYVDGSRDAQVLSLNKGDEEVQEEVQETVANEAQTNVVDFKSKNSNTVFLNEKDREIGNEPGNACPICRQGVVEDIGGCNTCTNCHAQLSCGL